MCRHPPHLWPLRPCLAVLSGVLALAFCDSGPASFNDCMLAASRESKNDRQFRKLADTCKVEFSGR
ncbi:MAG: hypothetical protein NBV65_13135 [Burkholderiaceae bacterium]|nr:hypothetical protein [Burkholderiaceae bacterium]